MSTEAMSAFVKAKVTPRFDQAVSDAKRKLEAATREVDDLLKAKGTLGWEVEGVGSIFINIADGQMNVEATASETPFMTIIVPAADFEKIQSGAAPDMMMGGSKNQNLGATRIQRIKGLKGLLRFVVSGLPDGSEMSTMMHFGADARPEKAQTTIRVPFDVAQKMQNNEINPQMAFMQGQLRMEGDAGLAMQFGMAMA